MLLKDKNLYYVGGVVRDEILGTPSLDTDFCYEGNAIEYSKKAVLNVIKTNPAFGTVRVYIDGKEMDIASTRTETYPRKGHLPVVENIGCSLKDDLKRRDFTINAMAKRTTDAELIDYYNGVNDIEKKVLRILHKDSFIDDPTRIVRGLKFSVRFGFELDDYTKKIQNEYLENVNYDMSHHRLKKELTETFNLDSADAYDRFIGDKIYNLLGKNLNIPDIKGDDIKNAFINISENKWFLYLAPIICLNSDIMLPLTRREMRIVRWVEKLKTQKPVNNTPPESILLKELLG